MEQDLDTATTIAIVLFSSILICSLFFWISSLNTPRKQSEKPSSIPPWSIGWVDFGLFICALVTSIALAQIFAVQLIDLLDQPGVDELEIGKTITPEENFEIDNLNDAAAEESSIPTPWLTVLSVLLIQIPMIATFYGLRTIYPNIFGGALNRKPVSIRRAILRTTPYFIRCFPIIWLAGLIWLGLLNGLQKLGILKEFPPQQLVSILSNGENPFAVALLVIFAVLLAPFVEEIIFRGAIYRFLKGKIPLFNAQLISSIFFALIHFNLMSFVPLIVIGVFLTRIYEQEREILSPMIFHAYWNGFSLLILFLTNQS